MCAVGPTVNLTASRLGELSMAGLLPPFIPSPVSGGRRAALPHGTAAGRCRVRRLPVASTREWHGARRTCSGVRTFFEIHSVRTWIQGVTVMGKQRQEGLVGAEWRGSEGARRRP